MQLLSPNSLRDTPDTTLRFIDLPSSFSPRSLETGHSPASSSREAKRQQRDSAPSRPHPTTVEGGSKRPRACTFRRYRNTVTSGERSAAACRNSRTDMAEAVGKAIKSTATQGKPSISASAFQPIARKTDIHEKPSLRDLETSAMNSNFIGDTPRPSQKREVSPRIVPLELLIKNSEECPTFPRKENHSRAPQQTLHTDSQIRSLAHEGARRPSTESRRQAPINLPKAPHDVKLTPVKESVASLRRDFKMLSAASTRLRDLESSAKMNPRSLASGDDGLLPVCSLPPRVSAQAQRPNSAVIDFAPQKRRAEVQSPDDILRNL